MIFFLKQMDAFGPVLDVAGRFNFQGNLCIAQDKIHFRAGRGSPEADGKIEPAVMPIGPALLENKMFKCAPVFACTGGKGFIIQQGRDESCIKEIKLGGFDQSSFF